MECHTSRQKASGIWQGRISLPAPGLPIALESASTSASEALPAGATDRKSLETGVKEENVDSKKRDTR